MTTPLELLDSQWAELEQTAGGYIKQPQPLSPTKSLHWYNAFQLYKTLRKILGVFTATLSGTAKVGDPFTVHIILVYK